MSPSNAAPATGSKATSLGDLPPELISQIISHSNSARTLRNLALSSRSLRRLIEADGWAAFVNNRFSSLPVPPHWRDAAHALTTLSKAFDRRAFIAQDAGPDLGRHTRIRVLPDGGVISKWRHRPTTQSIGYQPVIDSHEVFTGDSWRDRTEVVAWGAGAEVVVKIEERGREVQSDHRRLVGKLEHSTGNDEYIYDAKGGSRQSWTTYRHPGHLEGIHDITAMRILKSEKTGSGPDYPVKCVIGRASGGLEAIEISRAKAVITRSFDCGRAAVRCADVNMTDNPLLAACLSDSKINLYNVSGDGQVANPISQVNISAEHEHGSRCWSAQYLSRDRLAIGRGVSKRIVFVYGVRPEGMTEDPIRAFSSDVGPDRVPSTSAYPIVSVPQSSTSCKDDGNLFFSGGYDGIIRLHDMRSARDCESILDDPADKSAIYSLAMVGRERIIAGAAAHSLIKIFDLRMFGGRAYSYLDAAGSSATDPTDAEDDSGALNAPGWNVYVGRGPALRSLRPARQRESGGVYSLSRPSPSSSSLYVGLMNRVTHMNFTSATDQCPDPVFDGSIIRHASGQIDPKRTWDPNGRVVDLAMFEQSGLHMTPLANQRPIDSVAKLTRDPKHAARYDRRWFAVAGEHTHDSSQTARRRGRDR